MSLDRKVRECQEDFFVFVREYARVEDIPLDPDDITYFQKKLLEALERPSKEKRQ